MARCCHLEGSPAHGALVASDHPAGDGGLAEVVTYEGLLLSALQEVLRLHGYVPGQRGHITRGGGWQGHGSPEQLVVEHAGLVAGPVVLELRDVVVEGAEGVSAHQQRRALPPAQPEVLPTE